MAILNNNPLVGASGNQGGYNINNSLRFRASASAWLSRTPSASSDTLKWTWSAWVKKTGVSTGAPKTLFAARSGSNSTIFRLDDAISINYTVGGSTQYDTYTTAVFRDPSAWYHIVIVSDLANATAANRVIIYINGVSQTVNSPPPQNYANSYINTTYQHGLGAQAADWFFDGYMAEVNFVNAQALTPSSFGETDTTTGVWKPKAYTGTYGTNGFYLKFSDIATTSGSNAGLGKDFSGNSNYWTTNNISVTSGTTYDAMTDSPTNTSATVGNYCTLNPLRYGITYTPTVSEGNLKVAWAADTSVIIGTMNIPSSGKWYWEAVVPTQTYNFLALGVVKNQETSNLNSYLGTVTTGYGVYISNGQKIVAGVLSTYMAVTSQNTVITVAFDADTGTLYIGAGGSWANGSGSTNQTFSSAASIVTGLTGDLSPAFSFNTGNAIVNFGQRPFNYSAPSGFLPLNTYNLA